MISNDHPANERASIKDWPILYAMWERHCGIPIAPPTDLAAEVRALHKMHVYMPAAYRFLLEQRPDAEGFRRWLLEQQRSYHIPEQASIPSALVPTLSPQELRFWDEHGYVVLKRAISKQTCLDAAQAILDCLGARLDDPTSWHHPHLMRSGLMVHLSNHPALNANRESPRIRHAYETLYGSSAIYKTIDHVSFNPPESEQHRFMGDGLHWDVSLAQPIPQRLQGLLYLSDCGPTEGAFHCVPGFHRQIGAWLASLPPHADPRQLAPQSLKAVPVAGEAGDFVIWHQALPHCATPNHGSTPRMVQYLSYVPENCIVQADWI
jgi:Phytanoyl-CoA dioxygenase (PhyH)